MAIQEDTSADRKKSIDATDELQMFNAENMQNNTRSINYCRTFMSIIGGVIAGILGFTGLTGLVFYFLVIAITSVALAAKAKFSIHFYFDSWNRITLDGVGLCRSCYSGHLPMTLCIFSEEPGVKAAHADVPEERKDALKL